MTDSAPDATSLGIDLAVDTSAVIALLLREPGCEAIIERLCRAEQPALAAQTDTPRNPGGALAKLGEIGSERAWQFLEQQAIALVSWDRELADAAAAAFTRFGRGRHLVIRLSWASPTRSSSMCQGFRGGACSRCRAICRDPLG